MWNRFLFRLISSLLATVIALLVSTIPVYAEILSATDDTFANAAVPDKTYGDRDRIAITSWAPSTGLAKFDLSTIMGAGLDSATLRLGVQSLKKAGSISLHLVYSDWDEGTQTYNLMPTFEPTPFATIDVTEADVGETLTVDITEVVQAWASGSLTNYGIVIQPAGRVNVRLDSKETEGGAPMEIDADLISGVMCPPDTLFEPYTEVCAPVNDITHLFLPAAALVEAESSFATKHRGVREPDIPDLDVLRNREALKQGLGGEAGAPLLARATGVLVEMAGELPVPGGTGAGTNYKPGTLQALEHSVFHTKMFVQPDGVDSPAQNWQLMTPATNHTDSATEFVGIYASHLEEGWFGIFGRPCTEAHPCPDGDTSNGWQAGWSWPFSEFECNITDIVDQGSHRQKVMHYANETVKLDQGNPPLWQNAIYLWNYCMDEWDLYWRHQYRENKRDCSVEGCYRWGPILETFGTQAEINELGYEDSLLFHDGRWSLLSPDETNFVTPISPWILSHIDPNRGYGVGNRFIPADTPAIPLTDDSYTDGNEPDHVMGGRSRIGVASWAPKIGFAMFDLSEITGVDVDSALLKLGVQWVKKAGSIGLHLVYSNWHEDTLTYNLMPSFEPTPFATIDVTEMDVGETLTVDITELVQNWASGSLANYGIAIRPAGRINIGLDSKETEGGAPMEIETVSAD